MSEFSCPSCGNKVYFKLESNPCLICPSCRAVLIRGVFGVSSAGKADPVFNRGGNLRIGLRGMFNGMPFEIVGLRRTTHIDDCTDEWVIVFDDGKTGLICNSEGQICTCVRQGSDADVVLSGGSKRDFSSCICNGVSYTAADRGCIAIDDLDGELNFDPGSGLELYRVYLRSGKSKAGFIEYSDNDSHQELFLGRYCGINELKLDDGFPERDIGAPKLSAKAARKQHNRELTETVMPRSSPAALKARQRLSEEDRCKRFCWKNYAAACVFMLLGTLIIFAFSGGNTPVASFGADIVRGRNSIFVSEPFEVKEDDRNLSIEIRSDICDGWIDFDIALIDESDGSARIYDEQISFYSYYPRRHYRGHRRLDGYSTVSTVIPSVEAGTYRLRIIPTLGFGSDEVGVTYVHDENANAGSADTVASYKCRVLSGVPQFCWLWFFLILAGICPCFLSLRLYWASCFTASAGRLPSGTVPPSDAPEAERL